MKLFDYLTNKEKEIMEAIIKEPVSEYLKKYIKISKKFYDNQKGVSYPRPKIEKDDK